MRKQIAAYIKENHVIAAILLVVFGWFLLEIRGILVSFFIAFIIMAALTPAVDFLQRRGIHNTLAVLIAYLSVLIIFFVLVFPLFPFFSSQIQALFKSFPFYFRQTADALGFSINAAQVNDYITSEVSTIGQNAYTVTSKVLGGFFSVITIFVVSFYLLLDRVKINKTIVELFPKDKRTHAFSLITQMEEKLGAWVRGQLLLSLFIGVLTWVALTILGLPFALPLALIAAILELVPTLGPILAAVPAVMVALTLSPSLAALVVGVYAGIQMIENHLLVPKIMEKVVGLHPVVVIAAVMIGANLLGIIGALLSIPFTAMIVLILQLGKNPSQSDNTNS